MSTSTIINSDIIESWLLISSTTEEKPNFHISMLLKKLVQKYKVVKNSKANKIALQ